MNYHCMRKITCQLFKTVADELFGSPLCSGLKDSICPRKGRSVPDTSVYFKYNKHLDKSTAGVYRFGIQKIQGRQGGKQRMAKTAMTHARLTPEIKEKAETILRELGISISAAYEMFYRQIIAHQGIPFDLRIPNKDTLQAMKDSGAGKGKIYDSVEKMFEDLKS